MSRGLPMSSPTGSSPRRKRNSVRPQTGTPTSQPNIQPSSASSATSTQTFPSVPFQMPAIHFHTGALMNGTGSYMSSPTKLAPRKPPAEQVTASILDSLPGKVFPAVREFLATIDLEEADGGDGPNYSQYADKLIEKGYRHIHLLYDETPKFLQKDLELNISMGDAKQLLLHVRRGLPRTLQPNIASIRINICFTVYMYIHFICSMKTYLLCVKQKCEIMRKRDFGTLPAGRHATTACLPRVDMDRGCNHNHNHNHNPTPTPNSPPSGCIHGEREGVF